MELRAREVAISLWQLGTSPWIVRSFAILLSLSLALATSARAETPPPAAEQVLLTRDAALREVFPEAAHVEFATVAIDDALRARIEERLGRQLPDESIEVLRALGATGEVSGYALITEEIGKYHPITFIVGVTPAAKIGTIAVLIYRESHGADVKRQRFLRQFAGKGLDDPLRVSRDIINVSGATLSAHAIARGTKKVLVLLDECVFCAGAAKERHWQRLCQAGKPPKTRHDSAPPRGPLHRNRYLMGTLLEAECWGESAAVDRALDAAFDEIARLERLLSTFIPDSELSRVNRDAAREPVRVSSDTYRCIAAAVEAAEITGGAFDPTLAREGYLAVEMEPVAQTIRFRRDGLTLDLGGIGKGYALDRAAEMLAERGVTHALLNFGGQVLALDPPPGSESWLIGIRDPRSQERFLGYYSVSRASVSTSALYERGDHIIDPHTGSVAKSASATVCAPSATTADAFSTALLVLGAAGVEKLTPHLARGAVMLLPDSESEMIAVSGAEGPRFVAAPPAVADAPAAAGRPAR